jgi:hypothetical protein
MLNVGVSVPDDIRRNVATLIGDPRFTEDDEALLAEYASKVYRARTSRVCAWSSESRRSRRPATSELSPVVRREP